MPRFYFDIHDGERFTPDDEGLEFPDAQTARDKAVSSLPDIARDVMPDGQKRVVSSPSGMKAVRRFSRQLCRS